MGSGLSSLRSEPRNDPHMEPSVRTTARFLCTISLQSANIRHGFINRASDNIPHERNAAAKREDCAMKRMLGFLAAIGVAMPVLPGTAAEYPVSGRWSYEQTNNGASCPSPTMEFNGSRRLDSGSSAPDYRN